MNEMSGKPREDEYIFRNAGLVPDRKPERHALHGFPIVSADSHLCLGGSDFWYENAPAHLKDRVPRVQYNEEHGYWDTLLNGASFYPKGAELLAKSMEGRRGGWDMDVRMQENDAEGVDKEIAFPQNLLRVAHLKDHEARAFIFSEYNRYLAHLQKRAPGRFYGVGVCNYWDPEKAYDSVIEAAKLGLKTMMIPVNPGDFADGKKIYLQSRKMTPLWQAFEETDMAVTFHIAEGVPYHGGGALAITVMISLAGLDFQRIFSEFVFGRIFDLHPKLRVAFTEANMYWVPGMLAHAEIVMESMTSIMDYVPKLSPREYWAKHCAATFMHDPPGLRQIDEIGPENAMWSVDYPHNEGTFGYTGRSVDYLVKAVGMEKAKKLLGETAITFFKL
jgi:predicted TIM-barrel fold metal-dependent hydrolase